MKIIFTILILMTATVFAQNTKILNPNIKPIDVQKIVASKNVARVVTMANAEKLKKVKEQLKDKVPPAKISSLTLFSPINLTVKDSIVEEKAFLVFDSPETMSAYENQAVFSPTDSSSSKVKVVFNAPSAGFYVFDFYVKKSGSGINNNQSLRFVNFPSEITNRNLDAAQFQHQIFATQIKNQGWNVIWLESQNTNWAFLGVEISQVK